MRRDERPREVVASVPGDVLRALHRHGYLEVGLEPPAARTVELRRRLYQRVRAALRTAPRTRLVPIGEAAILEGVSVRTFRDQVTSELRPAVWVRGQRGLRELAVEVEAYGPLALRPRPRPLPGRCSASLETVACSETGWWLCREPGSEWRKCEHSAIDA